MSFPPALMPAWPDEHTASLSHGTVTGPEDLRDASHLCGIKALV